MRAAAAVAAAAAERYERGRRALRRRLALDFEPLHSALARGLGVPVQIEAAVYCTAAVEAMCDALFAAALARAKAATQLTGAHLQLALRGHSALAALLQRVPSAAQALGFFLDDATSRELYEQRLIGSGDATHLRTRRRDGESEDESALAERHARARREWTRRADAPFAAEDFAAVLKSAHPAFSLAYSAVALLDALAREFLNAACDALPLSDGSWSLAAATAALDRVLGLDSGGHAGDGDALFRFMTRTAGECVRVFVAGGGAESTEDSAARTAVRFRVVRPASAPAAALQSPPLGLALPDVSTAAPFAQLAQLMRRRGRIADDRSAWLAVYRGREVDARETPASLGLPLVTSAAAAAATAASVEADADCLVSATLGATNALFVFLVPRKWWDESRRSEARRGRLASRRPQDARVRSLVAAAAPRVSRSPRRRPPPVLDEDDSLSALLRLGGGDADAHADAALVRSLRAGAAAASEPGRPGTDRAVWAARVRALDALVERAQAARAAAAAMLASSP